MSASGAVMCFMSASGAMMCFMSASGAMMWFMCVWCYDDIGLGHLLRALCCMQ